MQQYTILNDRPELKELSASRILIGERNNRMKLQAYQDELEIVDLMIANFKGFDCTSKAEFLLLKSHLENEINRMAIMNGPRLY
jgi:hypothetical protein